MLEGLKKKRRGEIFSAILWNSYFPTKITCDQVFFFAAAAAKETRQTTGVSGVPFSPPSAAAKRKERLIADFIYDTSHGEGLFSRRFCSNNFLSTRSSVCSCFLERGCFSSRRTQLEPAGCHLISHGCFQLQNTGHLITCHRIRIASIVLCLVLQKVPTQANQVNEVDRSGPVF